MVYVVRQSTSHLGVLVRINSGAFHNYGPPGEWAGGLSCVVMLCFVINKYIEDM